MDERTKNAFKQAGWRSKRNYFYKALHKATLVIEYRNDKIFLNAYSNKTLDSIEEKQTCESLTAALSQSLQLEKKYVTQK